MKKYDLYVGIDVSSETLDVVTSIGEYVKLPNDLKGFKGLKKILSRSSLVVMEATGVYHYSLALFLYREGIAVCVENGLRIKRFVEMDIKSNKNDKADAQKICEYAMTQKTTLWHPAPEYIQQSEVIYQNIMLLKKGLVQYKNRLHATKRQENVPKIVMRELTKKVKEHKDAIEKLEGELEKIMRPHVKENLARLTSIPGVGKKTAMYTLLLTENFTKFEEAKQLISFVGLAPIEKRSGSSVWGRSSISKRGNPVLRNLLFMCSFNACKSNKRCKQLYERLVAKGKSKKLALIAVGNRLIKQMFGIIKNEMMYDETHVSIPTGQ